MRSAASTPTKILPVGYPVNDGTGFGWIAPSAAKARRKGGWIDGTSCMSELEFYRKKAVT